MTTTHTNKIIIDSPLGKLEIKEAAGKLIYCDWTTQQVDHDNASPILQKAKKQLIEYFQGKRMIFQLPLAPIGTAFQEKVWQALLTIPYGETRSYQQLAQFIKQPQACRAVGSANGKNPISIIIPCHRVIRASGDLGGYAGTPQRKKKLLELEMREG
ncbi:MAG: methylated-DNA--[protein]-cysteine S-methyltransferase [Legionellales bacterium]|nr:methylated-DNA--[protein]-cysteine S-methyltransferase [Legionellales bacterium]